MSTGKTVTPFTFQQLNAEMSKKFGKSAMLTLTQSNNADITHWTSTGVYGLDDAMSWGLPGGRIVEWYGSESAGKTTAMMKALIENARRKGINFVFDAEGTFDRDRYAQMGGDPESVHIIYADHLEGFYDQAKLLIKFASTADVPSNAVVLIAVDTITMIYTQDQLELAGDKELMASQSRVNSRHLPTIDKTLPANTCLLLMSQVRDNMGAAAWSAAEDKITTPGGRIIKFLASVRVMFGKDGQISLGEKEKRQIIGMKTKAKVTKSKIGPPFRVARYRIMFDHRGVDEVDHVTQAFLLKGVLDKVTGGYSIKGEKIKEAELAEWYNKHPKWLGWALNQTFELEHKTLDLKRYLGKQGVEGDTDDDGE